MKIVLLFIFFIFYFHESIFFNEEILLSFSLCFMFYIVYTYFSAIVWSFLKFEIDTIRTLIIDEFEDQLSRCYQSLGLLEFSKRIFYIPTFFCFWVYLLNRFVIEIGVTRVSVATDKFFFYALARLFDEHLKFFSNLQYTKVDIFGRFVKIFSFVLFNSPKSVLLCIPSESENLVAVPFSQISIVYTSISEQKKYYSNYNNNFQVLQGYEICNSISILKFSFMMELQVPFFFYFRFLV